MLWPSWILLSADIGNEVNLHFIFQRLCLIVDHYIFQMNN